MIAAKHFTLCRLTYGIYCQTTTVKTALSLSQGDRRKLKTWKLVLRAGSVDPETALSYAAIDSGCWGTCKMMLLLVINLCPSSPIGSDLSCLLIILILFITFSVICFPSTPNLLRQRAPFLSLLLLVVFSLLTVTLGCSEGISGLLGFL